MQQKLTEPKIDTVNLLLKEVFGYSSVLHVENLDIKNTLDETVDTKNRDAKVITSNYKLDDVDKKPAVNEALRFNSV